MSDYKDYGFEHEGPTHNLRYQIDELVAILGKDRNRVILDLGCGNGHLVNYLIGQGYNAYGTDASEKGISIARRAHPDRFFVQDLSSDTLPPELREIPFDTIMAVEVIEHLYNPEAFALFCRRHLRPGGELILTTPYHGYLKNLLLSLAGKWDSHMNPLWLGGHIKLWSAKTLTTLLSHAGFSVLAFHGNGRVPYLWKSMIIKARAI